ncbi:MAG TPA: response regulator [Terriglobales bacterium]|nr:response regulator [Terriglobales bacterium]
MKLKSLLLCRDPLVLQTLRRLLDEMGVEVEVCSELEFGMEMFSRKKFDAVIVDMEMRGAGDVMKALRRTASNKNMVTFALIDGRAHLKTAFEMGANFVVHKPISPERAKLTMRAAHNLMRRDRRNLNRHNLQVVASLTFEGGAQIQSIVTDLSDTGMSVILAEPLPGGRTMRITLPLPGTQKTIEGFGELVWADEQTRAGIRFVQLPQISQKQLLAEWLKHFTSFVVPTQP